MKTSDEIKLDCINDPQFWLDKNILDTVWNKQYFFKDFPIIQPIAMETSVPYCLIQLKSLNTELLAILICAGANWHRGRASIIVCSQTNQNIIRQGFSTNNQIKVQDIQNALQLIHFHQFIGFQLKQIPLKSLEQKTFNTADKQKRKYVIRINIKLVDPINPLRISKYQKIIYFVNGTAQDNTFKFSNFIYSAQDNSYNIIYLAPQQLYSQIHRKFEKMTGYNIK